MKANPDVGSFSSSVLTWDEDVKMVFLHFENVSIKGSNEPGRTFALFAQVDNTTSEFYFMQFTVIVSICDLRKGYYHLRRAYIEKFGRKLETQHAIWKATEARLDENNLLKSL